MKKYSKNTFLALFAGSLLSVSLSHAASLPITSSADLFIRGDQPNSTNQGATLIVGELATGYKLRSLLSFDLSALPAGATINSVQLVLHLAENDATAVDTSLTLTLHAVTQTWAEASVTWNNASAGTPWTTAGGTFDSTVLSSQTVPTKGSTGVDYTWDNTAEFLGIVRSAYASGTAVSFFLKDSDESTNQRELVRFVSNNGAAGPKPQLIIDYTVSSVPEPSTCVVILAVAGLAVATVARKRGKR
ncbi:MAG: DNRLRE domain-containing protein [Opitutaceae bacterium]|jgi:hypothetical protein|nr:DNRLRE domain-containing protein [Opitutaceae bacterium]